MRKAEFIVIHCSDSDVLAHNDVNIIKQWHQARGWKTVGYHYFIQANGTVQKGRKLDQDTIIETDEIGAHTLGVNDKSIGICLHGRTEFSVQQFVKLGQLCEDLKKQFGLTNADIKGHCEFESAKKKKKTCPNFDVARWKKYYLKPDKKKQNGKGNSRPDEGNESGNKAGSKRPAGSKQKGSKDPDKK